MSAETQTANWPAPGVLAQIAGQYEDFNQQVVDNKTLRGPPAQFDDADRETRFVTQVSLYASDLGVAIAQTSFDIGDSYEGTALRQFLSMLDLEGVVIQADAPHTSPAFVNPPQNRVPTCS